MDTDPGIRDHAALSGRKTEDRIQIKLADLRKIFDHTRHAQQDILYGFDVGRRMPAVTFQQTITANFANHFVSILVGQWRDAETYVAKDFNVNAAETKCDQRAEQLVFGNTDH